MVDQRELKSVRFPVKVEKDGGGYDSDSTPIIPVASSSAVGGLLHRASLVFGNSNSEAITKQRKLSAKRKMSIFVPDGERYGLPPSLTSSIPSPNTAATRLVEKVRNGSYGLSSKVIGSTEHGNLPKRVRPKDEEEGELGECKDEETYDDYYDDEEISFENARKGRFSGAGVLSTLMAISAAGSSAITSSVSRRSSVESSPSVKEDSEDEEVEKIKFTEEQRVKRGKSNIIRAAKLGKDALEGVNTAVATVIESTMETKLTPAALTAAKVALPRNDTDTTLSDSMRPTSPDLSPNKLIKMKYGHKKMEELKLKVTTKFAAVTGSSSQTPYTQDSPGYHLHHYESQSDSEELMCPLTACESKIDDSDTKTLVEPGTAKDTRLKGQVGPASLYAFGFPETDPSKPTVPGFLWGDTKDIAEREEREWEKEKARRQRKKDKKLAEQVYIVAHVAAVLSRQEFIMKLGRAFMMFGAPSHRLESQLHATARVLEVDCQVVYIPGVMLVSFGDAATHTSEIKFLKQANGLDLGNLLQVYQIYWQVIHDKLSVVDASVSLDRLMTAPPKFKLWQSCVLGGMASALVQTSSFNGSFIDSLAAFPLGAMLVFVKVAVSKNDLYSSLFEIVIACVNSFAAAALASTGQFCFAAVASGSVVAILPGYIVLCGSLELANRSIISGSVRLVYAVLYALFLGFGLSMGGEIWETMSGRPIVGGTDFTCAAIRTNSNLWYRSAPPQWVYFITVPIYLLIATQRNQQPFRRLNTVVMVAFGYFGWLVSFYSGKAFPSRPDISAALGAFTVGLLGNLYGKFVKGSVPFVLMVVGVMFQLPSGLANGGLLNFATATGVDGTSAYSSAGFNTAASLISVAIGMTVGLFASAALVNSVGGGRRRGTYLSSF